MKLTLDTGGDGDDLEARMYLAAVVGPFRAPQGRPVSFPPVEAEIAINNTAERILFVSVSPVGAVFLARFAQTGGTAAGVLANTAGPFNFILRPGERLVYLPLNAVTITVFTSMF